MWAILLGALIVVITGFIDDRKELSPLQKSIGLFIAALEIYFVAGLKMDTISIPFFGMFHLYLDSIISNKRNFIRSWI